MNMNHICNKNIGSQKFKLLNTELEITLIAMFAKQIQDLKSF